MAIFNDKRDLSLTAAGADAARAYDHTIDGYLSMAPDTGDRLKAVFAADGEMVMAHCLKAYFIMLMAMGGLMPKAQQAAAKAQELAAGASPRERMHARAAMLWTHRNQEGACIVWEEILLEYPRDILAARLAHFANFYSGDARRLRDSVNRLLPFWDEGVAGFSYFKGMQAFGFEEAGEYAPAQAAAEKAIELEPNDPWATHAYAHVMEMQDRQDDGLAWIDRLRPYWSKANNFQNHIWWHEALMMMDQGRMDDVVAQYDAHVAAPDSEEYLDLCNAASLLQRLEIMGIDVGDRWQPLAGKVRERTEEHLLTFVDLHYALALAAAGDAKVHEMREFMAAYEGPEDESNLPIMKALGVPLVDALIAYRDGRYGEAIEAMTPVRYEMWQMGGSHAQRDMFDLILIDAAQKAGNLALTRALLSERRAAMPGDHWTEKAFGELAAAE
jgi:tetratricopeptide (TPR) repeat protein